MKTFTPMVAAAVLAGASAVMAQTPPGAPEDNGLTPKSETSYINRQTTTVQNINNNNTEAPGVAIANSGNILVGWEDDGDGMQDIESVWTLFDSTGVSITPDTTVTSLDLGDSLVSKYLSYFRADGSAVFGGTSWGPKIKANLFGDGLGMGATSYSLSLEVAEFAPWDDANQGDAPSVQLLDNTGKPVKLLPGVSSEYATRDPGNIRIADWEQLSNGNVVIVGESRQAQDLVDIYGGDAPATHAVFRILTPAGVVVKAETLASETPIRSEMWHGVGVTKDGFAVRFNTPSGVMIRMFDNAGNPTSANIDLAALTGIAPGLLGGRGDGAGFHGNGKDAYVHAAGGGSDFQVAVLNANGTLRYAKTVCEDLTLTSVGRGDAAIDADGNVVVAYDAKFDPVYPNAVMGRRFDATGKALGKTFYVSEKELPGTASYAATTPRVAWRSGAVAFAWLSNNDFETVDPFTGEPMTVMALRLFSTFTPGSIESVGLTRIVADTPIIKPAANALGNWEPYASVLGTTTFLIEGGTFVDDGLLANQRYVVALQPAAGGAMKLGEGFYADNGQPFTGKINYSRQNGNPGRVAGDTRPGAVNFMVGGEASPHAVPTAEFQSDNRWNLGFDRLSDGRYGTIQAYSLNTTTLVQTPLCKAQDSAFGRLTSGTAAGNQISRFGGDVVCLNNGNFVSVVEDRSRAFVADSDCVTATIFAPNGSIVKDSWVIAKGDIWANVAACKDGFAVRCKPQDGSATRLIYFFDNAGNLKGSVDQASSGASFDPGRGDGTRIFGHINSPYVYLAARAVNTAIVKVAAFDSRTQKFVAIADVNEGSFTGNFDRAFGAVDALNRLTVSWVSQPTGYAKQQVAARVLSFDGTKFTPLTRSFFPFVNANTNDIRSLQMSVAMTTKQICVAAKGEINYENKPELGPNSPTEVNFFTVFTHPFPQDDPTAPVSGEGPTVTVTRASSTTLSIGWAPAGGTLQSAASLGALPATWVDVGTQNPATVTIGAGNAFYRVKR